MVYFYWTGDGFTFGDWLAVATAERHTTRDVVVYVEGPPPTDRWFAALGELPNVQITPFLARDFMTAAEHELYEQLFHRAHRADLARLALLRSRGGLYLDTDTITLQNLDDLPDAFVVRDATIVHLGVLAMTAGHPWVDACLRRLVALEPACFDHYASVMYVWTSAVDEAANPAAAAVLPLQSFCPVPWTEWASLFERDQHLELDEIVVLHHYGAMSRSVMASIDRQWLASNPCPISAAALRGLETSIRAELT